jgi:PAB-dependent poly(A)-specific ribonuclease subunit 3
LDAGSSEKLMLMSRDELSSFIVSYGQIKTAIQEAFSELVKAGKNNY